MFIPRLFSFLFFSFPFLLSLFPFKPKKSQSFNPNPNPLKLHPVIKIKPARQTDTSKPFLILLNPSYLHPLPPPLATMMTTKKPFPEK